VILLITGEGEGSEELRGWGRTYLRGGELKIKGGGVARGYIPMSGTGIL